MFLAAVAGLGQDGVGQRGQQRPLVLQGEVGHPLGRWPDPGPAGPAGAEAPVGGIVGRGGLLEEVDPVGQEALLVVVLRRPPVSGRQSRPQAQQGGGEQGEAEP